MDVQHGNHLFRIVSVIRENKRFQVLKHASCLYLPISVSESKPSPGLEITIIAGSLGSNLKIPNLETKESNSTANESKRQFNRSIIYYLNIVPVVNDSFWNSSKKFGMVNYSQKKKRTVELPGLELTAGEVLCLCQSWMLYLLWQIIMNINKFLSFNKLSVVLTIAILSFTLVLKPSFSLSQQYRNSR